ncbi:MAG: DUF1993 domain-containing protein [Kofleriaceae bacterium]
MYFETFGQLKKMLGQVDRWLDAATAYAQTRSFDPNVLLAARLAPDQFPLVRQVQSTCDIAKSAAARLTGKEAPVHPDTEQTIEELHARVRSVIGYLDGFTASDFEGAATRTISHPRWQGTMTGEDYFREHAIPNFYFHATHVYALLRHNGVPLGKKDYLGKLTQS